MYYVRLEAGVKFEGLPVGYQFFYIEGIRCRDLETGEKQLATFPTHYRYS